MKKTNRTLILLITILGFTSTHTVHSSNTIASSRQAENPRHSEAIVRSQIAAADDDWVIECVDCQDQYELNSVSLQLDSDDHLHIAYTGNSLYYAEYDGENWKLSIVDETTLVSSRASLALDVQGFAHISYFDATNADLKYAVQDENGWNIVTVDQQGDVGESSSIVLDRRGYPHISYVDGESNEDYNLKYAYMDEDGWHIFTLDSGGIATGIGNALVLDLDGYPHISYLEFHTMGPVSSTLKYAYQDESGWQIENVAEAVLGETSLRLDSDGQAHIIYPSEFFTQYADISYAYQDESGWHTRMLQGGTMHHYNAMEMDELGHPHITFVSGMYKTFFEVIYAYFNGYDWQFYPVAFLAHYEISGGDNSLALDKDGLPHIVYIDETGQNLMYAYREIPFPIIYYQFLPMLEK